MSAEHASAAERIAARLVTGPVAFLLSGVIDVTVFTSIALRRAVAGRVEARRTS